MQEKKALLDALRAKNMMVLYRDQLAAEEYAGIPVSVEDELTILQKENNFTLDGYAALRTGDVTETEQMDDSPFCRRVLEGEKVYDAVHAPGFDCRSWSPLLNGIRKNYEGWATIQCESGEEPVYYVGKISSIEGRYVSIRCVDADGTWHPDEVSLPLDDLTLVTFGDRYLNVFRKYCKG